MLIEEEVTIESGAKFIHKYSDLHMMIRATYEPYVGALYDEVYCLPEFKDTYTYEETDIPIEEPETVEADNH